MTNERFAPGAVILQRGYNAANHKLIEVRPAIVVEDSPTALILYFAAGSTFLSGDFMLGSRRNERSIQERVAVYVDPAPLSYAERVNPRHVLSILPAGAMHAVWYFWDRDWDATHCFVNVQAPYTRAAEAIEVIDYYLDIAAGPVLEWRWKDVDEFEAMCAHGVFTGMERDAIWEEARREAARLEARAWPFEHPWSRELIDPAWPIPAIAADHHGLAREAGDTPVPSP